MYSIKKIGRITGVLLLIQMIIGILINVSLLGPLIFTTDFITKISENTNQVLVSVLLLIITKTIGIGVAIMLLPTLKKIYKSMAFWYLSFSIILFVISVIDNTIILSLVSFTEQYQKSSISDVSNLETLGRILQGTRGWVHMMDILIASIPLFIFYYLMYISKLVPRVLSALCVFSAVLIFVNVLWTIFGTGSMYLYMPMALTQFMFIIWLIAKGFKESQKLQETV